MIAAAGSAPATVPEDVLSSDSLSLAMPPAPRPGITLSRAEEHAQWPTLARIPLRLTALLPLPRFTVADLLSLRQGKVIETLASCADNVPVRAAGVQLAWCEFEVVDQRIAIRLTRLA